MRSENPRIDNIFSKRKVNMEWNLRKYEKLR